MANNSTTKTKPATANMTAGERLQIASARCREAELAGMSVSTINKRYRELFAAEDAVKVAAGAWHGFVA